MPSGRACAVHADHASAGIVRAWSGAPFTENVPAS